MSALFGPPFQALLGAALRRVRSLRGRRDTELRARRQVGAPRGAFAGHRRYSSGDDVRLVDWSAYARTRELFAKVYEEDERRALTILLDCSPSMAVDGRFDGARRLAALLGTLAIARLDGLRLVCGGDQVFVLPQGAAGARKLLRSLEALAPTGSRDPRELSDVPIERGWLGSTVWISDFACPESWRRALRGLRASGRVCHGLLPTVLADTAPAVGGWLELVDPETGETEVVRVDEPLRAAIAHELERLARHREAVFHAAGVPLLRLALPAQDDFRLESWTRGGWISRI